jgi:hypothetical protein
LGRFRGLHNIKVQEKVMKNRSFVSGALKLATGAALCTFALAAQADPLSLDATCHLTSTIPGSGTCQINYSLTDNMTGGPAQVRRAQIRIDNILVAQYVNDSVNPSPTAGFQAGFVEVACAQTHGISARIARAGQVGYEPVGSLPPVACPAAP